MAPREITVNVPIRRVVSDREGGWVGIDPLERGRFVMLVQGISPPIKTKADRELRRTGLRAMCVLSALWFATSVLALLLALALAVGRG